MKRCKPKISPVLTFIALTLTLLATGCASRVKYTIVLIGDGMGPNQIDVARQYVEATTGKPAELSMDKMAHYCRTTTFSANSSVTDSAASGTAIACGVKTNNGMLGLAPNGDRLTSVAEIARDTGHKVGIITTVPTNHATPAAHYAHVKSRNSYDEIAEQFLDSNFDVLAGGGVNYKGDKAAYYDKLRAAGYAIAAGRDEMVALLPGDKAMITYDEKRTSFPMAIEDKGGITLAELTAKTIELLDGDEGFFLMVEGGMIDWSGHNNDLAANVGETLEFDKAVAVALDFYRRHPNETLVVFTADHETGGMQLAEKLDADQLRALATQSQEYSTLRYRIMNLPEESQHDWQAAAPILLEATGLTDLTRAELKELQKAWMDSTLPAEAQKALGWSKYHPAVETALKIKARRCGVSWTTHGHTATPVVTGAIGVGAEDFLTATDNTQIAAKIMKIYGCSLQGEAEEKATGETAAAAPTEMSMSK